MFEDLLVKLESQGLYVTQQSGESLAQYQKREQALLAENERLLATNKQLKDTRRKILENTKNQVTSNYFRSVFIENMLPDDHKTPANIERLRKKLVVFSKDYGFNFTGDDFLCPNYIYELCFPEYFAHINRFEAKSNAYASMHPEFD